MLGYLKRLLASGAAYQVSSIFSAGLALVTLPLYTRHLRPADYGYAETLLTFIILTSILLRVGLGEAFVRFWFDDEDPIRRRRLARSAVSGVLVVSTVVSLIGVAVAGPLSQALLNHRDARLMEYGLLGLWAFTNLEMGYALLRVEERRRAYATTSIVNVLLTVALTVLLVVVGGHGARGYVLGNYAASATVLIGLWLFLARTHLGGARGFIPLGPLMRFGAPTIPAEAAVFALNVVDRAWLLRADSPAAAGLYAVAVKVSTGVIVAVRGFQAAWPPLAYSIEDDEEAGRLYAFVTTAYVAFTGFVVAGATLMGRWLVRVFAAPQYYAAHRALPWVALGWALYGLVLVFVSVAGRARVTTKNFPAAAAGLAVNVAGLALLIGPLGIVGAGIALCAAYIVMLTVLHRLTRALFAVPFELGRLALAVGVNAVVAVGGELLLPTHGLAGFGLRVAALALIPLLLVALRFLRPDEIAAVRGVLRRRRPTEV